MFIPLFATSHINKCLNLACNICKNSAFMLSQSAKKTPVYKKEKDGTFSFQYVFRAAKIRKQMMVTANNLKQCSPFAMSRKVADVFVIVKGEVPDSIFNNNDNRISTQYINNYK